MQELRLLDSTKEAAQPLPDLFNGPLRVFGDQWLGIGCGAFEDGQIFSGPDVAQRDANVAQETAPFDPFDR